SYVLIPGAGTSKLFFAKFFLRNDCICLYEKFKEGIAGQAGPKSCKVELKCFFPDGQDSRREGQRIKRLGNHIDGAGPKKGGYVLLLHLRSEKDDGN
ncbi:MAG: hypothetical protein HW387_1455, partial [Parachlamydiales bacterium]|nr:hypothetical protein [Parachlamydiales bacterium]